jgi:predicted nuclease with TOPRIM domain
MEKIMAKDDMVTADEFRTEKEKLETDRAQLNERLQALNAEREKCIQQLTMIAGALQTVNHFIARIDPEVSLEDEIDVSDIKK